MFKLLWLVTLVAGGLADEGAVTGYQDAARKLAEAERAFARTALQSGVRAAFLEWLEPGATIFRPQPVDGPEFHRAGEPGPEVLIWEPAITDLAASEDLGYSSGPWKYQVDADSPPVIFGHFISIWRRQADGSWRVAADIGVSCDSLSARFGEPWLPVPAPAGTAPPGRGGGETPASDPEATDAAFRAEGVMANPPLDPQIRLYRMGRGPVIGVEDALSILTAEGAAVPESRIRTVVSRAGDFAATWGTERSPESIAPPQEFSFLRVWRRGGMGDPWLLRLEVRLQLTAP